MEKVYGWGGACMSHPDPDLVGGFITCPQHIVIFTTFSTRTRVFEQLL